MRIVVALGGNALLRRGEPMTADVQRANCQIAAKALAPLADEHELVITHGNGPQVGLLALQSQAYTAVDPYPLDVLGAQTEGMIGYMLEQELGNILPFFLGREEHGFAAVPHPTAEALPFLQRGQIIRHAPAIFHPSDQNEIRVIAIEDVRILDRECRSDFLDEDIQYFGHLLPLCELVSDLSCFLQVKVDLLR